MWNMIRCYWIKRQNTVISLLNHNKLPINIDIVNIVNYHVMQFFFTLRKLLALSNARYRYVKIDTTYLLQMLKKKGH